MQNSWITDLERIRQLAAARQDEFEVLRYQLEAHDDITDAELDAFIEQLAAPVIGAIDCTQCANCCRSLDVYLTPSDADRLAEGIDNPVEVVITRHVNREEATEQDEWGKLRGKPCVFLDGKLCSVYEHRPETCRMYPRFTPDFRWTLQDSIEGASLCPIIYNVLSHLIDNLDKLYPPPEENV